MEFATEGDDEITRDEVARETASAARSLTGRAGSGSGPTAVPVSRAVGGTRNRRRSDQRWEVTEADLNMYGLIVGRPPTEAEKVAALTPVPNEATALRDAGAGRGGLGWATFPRWGGRSQQSDGRATWSPSVMFDYLRDVYHFGANLSGPQVSAWVRQMSGEARRRLQETQARLAAPRSR
jgi:hypothetical protein